MKSINNVLITLFVTFFFTSCKVTEYVTKVETQIDTVRIEKSITDTVFHERKIELTKEVKSNVFLPCPDENSKPSSGSNHSGENYSKWQYDEEKGGYNIELYCSEQINRLDSINRKLTIENKDYKSSVSISAFEKLTVKENLSLWAKVMKEIWKVLFFAILALWLFGFTPKFIFKKLIG